jgi:hypothetical protein
MKTFGKSSVMFRAWSLVRSAGMTIGAALSQAWKEAKIEAVKQALTIGFVWITFRKVDGTITTRKATRNADLVPDPDKPKGAAAGTATVLCFYSETDHAWRSLRTDNLIRFKAA